VAAGRRREAEGVGSRPIRMMAWGGSPVTVNGLDNVAGLVIIASIVRATDSIPLIHARE